VGKKKGEKREGVTGVPRKLPVNRRSGGRRERGERSAFFNLHELKGRKKRKKKKRADATEERRSNYAL